MPLERSETIALIGAITAFVLAVLMAILVVFGIVHARRVSETGELEVHAHHVNTGSLVTA